MTKDRRLGRGLAALLGTPLEEDGIVEGASSMRSSEGNTPSSRSTATISHRSDQQQGVSQVRSSNAGASRNHATNEVTERSGVTGSVPLAGRASGKRSSTNDESGHSNTPDSKSPAANHKSGFDESASSDDSRHVQSLELNVCDIDNNPFQPRRRFNETEIASLAESIREHEQLQPILVRRVGDRYQLISGERRLRATIHAGFTTIRAELREADDRLVAELAIVENLQRKDLDAIEKAMSFRRYIDEHECKQEDLAKRLKIDRSTIANLMRLLELPTELQAWVQNEKITAGHARTLLPLGDERQQLQFARQIIEEGWTVRETERRVAAHLLEEDEMNPGAVAPRSGPRSGPRKRGTPHLASLEQQLRLSLGTKTEIRQHNNGKGKIVIAFSNPEEFERLFALICPQTIKKAA